MGSEFKAVASTYLRPFLSEPDSAAVVASGPGHAYLRLGRSGRLLALEAEGGLGLPVSMAVSRPALSQAVAAGCVALGRAALGERADESSPHAQAHRRKPVLAQGHEGLLGSGSLRGGGAGVPTIVVHRWRDQRLVLSVGARSGLRRTAARLRSAVSAVAPPPEMPGLRRRARAFTEAAASTDSVAIQRAARLLVGLGSGSTPAGDDIVAAALAVSWAFKNQADAAPSRLHDALASAVTPAVLSRTTDLSAELIRCAAAGHVLRPFQRLLAAAESGPAARPDAESGHAGPADADLGLAMAALTSVGSSSGYYLAAGALAALESAAAPQTKAEALGAVGTRSRRGRRGGFPTSTTCRWRPRAILAGVT